MSKIINTFNPYYRLVKRTNRTHDWFSLNIIACNQIQLHISILGYGITIGVLIFDVMKETKNDMSL